MSSTNRKRRVVRVKWIWITSSDDCTGPRGWESRVSWRETTDQRDRSLAQDSIFSAIASGNWGRITGCSIGSSRAESKRAKLTVRPLCKFFISIMTGIWSIFPAVASHPLAGKSRCFRLSVLSNNQGCVDRFDRLFARLAGMQQNSGDQRGNDNARGANVWQPLEHGFVAGCSPKGPLWTWCTRGIADRSNPNLKRFNPNAQKRHCSLSRLTQGEIRSGSERRFIRLRRPFKVAFTSTRLHSITSSDGVFSARSNAAM